MQEKGRKDCNKRNKIQVFLVESTYKKCLREE